MGRAGEELGLLGSTAYVESLSETDLARIAAYLNADMVGRNWPDTIVAIGSDSLGKPSNPAEAVDMLLRLSGRDHFVYTGLAVRSTARLVSGVERTRVSFRQLARPECEEYVATGEPLDKAGAYGIQGHGAALIERVDGDFYNVVGLPVQLLFSLLSRHGVRYDFAGLKITPTGNPSAE